LKDELSRAFPVDSSSTFDDLIQAIDKADRGPGRIARSVSF
jgi:hypothetical protein